MALPLSYYSLSLFFGGVISLISALVVFYNDRNNREHCSWFLLNISSAVWSFGYMAMILSPNQNIGYSANLILHAGAIFIPVFYFYFVISLVGKYVTYRAFFRAMLGVAGIFLFLNFSSLFIRDVYPKHVFRFAPDAGGLYGVFTVYFFGLTVYALWILFRRILSAEASELRRLRLIFFASVAGFAGGGSVFFLTFNIPIPPYAIPLYSLYPIIITYAILKHHLFDVKVIATELFTFGLWIILLSQVFLSNSLIDALVSLVIFLVVFVFGIYLIRSVIQEVKSRERIQALAADLASANEELKKLDAAKSEFISIAGHQLRTPLTVIKGYASMVIEGSFGEVGEKAREAINKVFVSSVTLTKLVADLLDLSRIESGKIRYDMKEMKLEDVVYAVIGELQETAAAKSVTVKFSNQNLKSKAIFADIDKIHELVINLIDNAIKYSEKGRVDMSLSEAPRDGKEYLLLSVKDTGMGIKAEDIPKLFTKFVRSEEARKVRPDGMGIGLYFVKKIAEDHRGRVWAESPGLGKGSTFFVELPVH